MSKLVMQIISTPVGGGAEFLVRELGRLLRSSEFDTEVVYFRNCSVNGTFTVEMTDGESTVGMADKSLFTALKLRKVIKNRRKNYSKVIIHAHLTWPFFQCVLATLFLGVTLVYTEHSTTNRRRRLKFLKYIERLFYARYKTIICISEGVKQALSDWINKTGDGKLVVIENGAKIYNFKERSLINKPNLVSIGSLTKKKGFITAIRAIPSLKDEIDTYKIIGDGPERETLERLIVENGLKGKVKLEGWSHNVEKYLLDADLQLIPSIWEGFGLVAVEGMSTGISVVASNVEGLRSVLDSENPAVNLVDDYENPGAWELAIRKSIRNLAENGADVALGARKQAEKFSLEKMASKYSNLYSSL